MLFRLRARGALEDRLEELGVGPMRTKITDEELENARARIADERARKVSVFPPKSVEHTVICGYSDTFLTILNCYIT